MYTPFDQHAGIQAYLANRLNSIFHGYTPAGPLLVGSNNAGVSNTPSPMTRARGNGAGIAGLNFGGSYGTATNNPYSVVTPGMGNDSTVTGPYSDWSIQGDKTPKMPGFGIASFAAGGMMGADGSAIRPGVPVQNTASRDEPLMGADEPMPMDGTQIDQEAQRFVQANPQAVQQVRAVIMHAIQSGELTYDELNMAVQLAKTALANPASYPQLRQFAIKNGLGTEQDLPQTIDRGLLFTLLLVGKTLQAAGGTPGQGGSTPTQGNMVAPQGQSKGGLLPEYDDGGTTGDKKHLAIMHPREYVATETAVMYHGKKTYDKLEEQARMPKDGSQGS